MKRGILSVAVIGMVLAGLAAPTAEEVNGRWQLTVPEGEEYRMTADDVALIGDRAFQKAGGGLLIAGDEMVVHTGDVYIVDGLYRNSSRAACGSTNAPKGSVYINGGTFVNTLDGASGDPNILAIPRNLYLQGEGYCGFGAVSNITFCQNLCYNATFLGDTKLTGTQMFNFRYDTINQGGHKIVVDLQSGYGLMFVATTLKNPGDIEVRSGYFGFESNVASGSSSAQSLTFAEGTTLRLSVFKTVQGYTMSFADNTRIENVSWDKKPFVPATGYHGRDGLNIGTFTGPATLQGTLKMYNNLDMGVTFSGPVSGPGGFVFTSGTWLGLANAANSFENGVNITGQSYAGDLSVTGGLALAANGALPVNGKPLKMKNALLGLYSANEFDLPALEFDGKIVVTGGVDVTACRAASLKKTGDGPLTVFGPLAVAGETDIQKGTLRFGTRVPEYLPGLYWAHDNLLNYNSSPTYTPEQLQAMSTYQGVDRAGWSYAYKSWVNSVATTNVSASGVVRVDWHNNHYYAGYMKIPGEEGTEKTCRFIGSLARYLKIVIDDSVVYQMDDGKLVVPSDVDDPGGTGNSWGWKRHAWSNPIALKAGWHKIYCYMGNHYQSGGPVACDSSIYGLWPYNFGIGVNYNASADDSFDIKTNAVNYVKLQDPGDGSLFRLSTNATDKVTRDPAPYRPTFAGSVAFASGTTLDIADVRPYVAVTVPSLIGVPTILNGRVVVGTSAWTLRAADVVGGTPLTVGADAELAFPDGDVTVDMSADELTSLEASRKQAPFVLMAAAEGSAIPENAFKLSTAFKSARWRLVRANGQLALASANGLTVTVR